MASEPIRVLIADDHPIVLEGIKSILAADLAIELVAAAACGKDVLRLVQDLSPDILVLDMSMPDLNGVTVAERLHSLGSTARIIAHTVHEDPGYVHELLSLGLGGYVLKRSASAHLLQAIQAVAAGGLFFDPSVAASLAGRAANPRAAPASGVMLSQREEEILRLVAEGHASKAIAGQLGLSARTVETYKERAMTKLGLQSRVDLIRYAADRGWLGSPAQHLNGTRQ